MHRSPGVITPTKGERVLFMNEYEIENAVVRFASGGNTPFLAEGAGVLYRLMTWTNNNSDGWPYWRKPTQAASRLMTLLLGVDRYNLQDVTPAELKAACTPIKSFLTRQGVDHAEVFASPATAPAPTLWENDLIQFARLLDELQAIGGLPGGVLATVAVEMDLDVTDVHELLDRAQRVWDAAKARV